MPCRRREEEDKKKKKRIKEEEGFLTATRKRKRRKGRSQRSTGGLCRGLPGELVNCHTEESDDQKMNSTKRKVDSGTGFPSVPLFILFSLLIEVKRKLDQLRFPKTFSQN